MTARAPSPEEDAVREYVLDTHGELLDATLACAEIVAESWDGKATTEREAVVGPFEHVLDRTGTLDRFPGVLVGAVDALGNEAEPVTATYRLVYGLDADVFTGGSAVASPGINELL